MIPQLIALRERVNALESTASVHAESMSQLGQISALRGETLDGILARLERLESARIAPQVAPESAETASGVPQEPGNTTGYYSGAFDVDSDDESQLRRMIWADDPEVAAALRMYRKVQGCRTAPNGDVIRPGAGNVLTAHILLAWLKEGEA